MHKCIDCGIKVHHDAKRCRDCYNKWLEENKKENSFNKEDSFRKEETQIIIDELTNRFAKLIEKDYKLKRYPDITADPKGKQEEIANLVISDLHAGMINTWYNNTTGKNETTYNDTIRKKQEINYIRSVKYIYNLFSHAYYFKELKIYLLGDLITNDRVFDGQQFEISKGYGEQIWEVVFELADMINILSSMFPKTKVYCCVGNHGRSNQVLKSALNEPVTNNFEYTLYRILKLMLEKNKKIEVIVPESRFYSTTNYDHKIFMSHGDTIRGFSSGYLERKAKELLINLPEGYNLYILGHRHVAERKSISPTAEVLVNGSWVNHDNYAFDIYGTSTKAIQYFFGSSRKRVISWLFGLDFLEIN